VQTVNSLRGCLNEWIAVPGVPTKYPDHCLLRFRRREVDRFPAPVAGDGCTGGASLHGRQREIV